MLSIFNNAFKPYFIIVQCFQICYFLIEFDLTLLSNELLSLKNGHICKQLCKINAKTTITSGTPKSYAGKKVFNRSVYRIGGNVNVGVLCVLTSGCILLCPSKWNDKGCFRYVIYDILNRHLRMSQTVPKNTRDTNTIFHDNFQNMEGRNISTIPLISAVFVLQINPYFTKNCFLFLPQNTNKIVSPWKTILDP